MDKFQLKSEEEIEIMRTGGAILAMVRQKTADFLEPGMTTAEADAYADKLIREAGAEAGFKKVPGYHHATCININEVVVHGIPGSQVIRDGDVVGIDAGVYYGGFNTDAAVTVSVGKKNDEIAKFLARGKEILNKTIKLARPGNFVWDLSREMQKAEEYGYGVVRSLTGHGVGKSLHEEPAIPCFTVGKRENSPKIVPRMTLAIEIMYNMGSGEVVYKNRDGWTITTVDGKISALFEETVAVTATSPELLTTTIKR